MSEQDSLFKEPGTGDPSGSTPTTPFSTPQGAESDLALQLKTAQRQLSNLMIVLLVVSGTLAIFLLQQVRYARADVVAFQNQAEQIEQARQVIANYNEKFVPKMQTFQRQLGEYASTHPDVLPILAKYGLARRTATPSEATPAPQ